MTDSNSERNPVDVLADEFLDRYRRGERPPLNEYTDRHPELADEICELFPLLQEMESARSDGESRSRANDDTESGATALPPLRELGDYRILREVGRGGMGIVYEAEQISLGRRVALKVLPQQMLLNENHHRRFEREARSAGKLHHTNIVPVFGVGQADGYHFYVMQFIQGLGLDEVVDEVRRINVPGSDGSSTPAAGSLRVVERRDVSAANVAQSLVTGQFERTKIVNESGDATLLSSLREEAVLDNGDRSSTSHSGSGSFAVSSSASMLGASGSHSSSRGQNTYWLSVAHIGRQVAEALDYAHKQGVLHRDIKPSNLLLDLRGTVWVTDFGLAKASDQKDLTHTGDILGTIRYIPPESFEGTADVRGDVYSLGLTLYELLALRPAFNEQERHRLIKQVTTSIPERLEKLNPGIPRDLVTIVHKAIDRDPEHRYQTPQAMAEDLERFGHDEPIRARRSTAWDRVRKWARRNPALAAASAAVAFLLMAVTVVSVVAYQQTAAALVQAEMSAQDAEDERDKALAAKQVADEARDLEAKALVAASRNYATARDAVDKMYVRAAEELRDKPQMEVFRQALLEDALEFYQVFLAQEGEDPDVRLETAKSHRRVGEILGDLGDWARSQRSQQDALLVLGELVEQFPNNSQYRDELALAHYRHGDAASKLLRVDEAVASFEQAMSIWKALNREFPDQPAFLHDLASAHLAMGGLWKSMHFSKGGDIEARGKQLRARVEREFPDFQPGHRTSDRVGVIDYDIDVDFGGLPHSPEKLREIEQNFRQVLARVEQEAAEHPAMPLYRGRVVQVLRRMSFVLQAQQRYAEAEPFAARRLKMQRELSEEFPQLPTIQKNFAWALQHYAWLLYHAGSTEEAADHFEEAIAVLEKLVARHPDNTRFMGFLAGQILFCPVERLRNLDRTIELLQKTNEVVSEGINDLALAQALAGRYADAQASLEQAVRQGSQDPGTAAAVQAILLRHQGKQEAARDLVQQVVRQMDSVPNGNWYKLEFRYAIRRLEQLVGITVAKPDNQPAPRGEGERIEPATNTADAQPSALERLSSRIEAEPNNVHHRVGRAHAYLRLNQPDDAVADFSKAIELAPEADAAAWWLCDRGAALAWKGDFAQAQRSFVEGLPLLVEKAKYRPDAHLHWYRYLVLCAQLSDADEHRRVSQEMLELFADTTDPQIVERIAKATLWLPGSVDAAEMAARLEDLADTAKDKDSLRSWYPLAQGMAEYRSRRFAESIERLQGSRAASNGWAVIDTICRFFEAMALYHLGRPSDAQSSYAAGLELLEAHIPKLDSGNLGGGWTDVLVCHVVRREAETLLKTRQTDEYLAKLQAAIEQQKQRAEESSADLELQYQLGSSYRDLAGVVQSRGDHAAAARNIRESIEVFKKLVAQQPEPLPMTHAKELHAAVQLLLDIPEQVVEPAEQETLLHQVIDAYGRVSATDAASKPSDEDAALIDEDHDSLIGLRLKLGDFAGGIEVLTSALKFVDGQLAVQPKSQVRRKRKTALEERLTRQFPRLAVRLLREGNAAAAETIYEGLDAYVKETGNRESFLLNQASWFVTRERRQLAAAYEQALAWARRAIDSAPNNGAIMNTLGVAEYRAGDFAAAVETLNASAELNARSTGAFATADLAFLAMAHHQLSNDEEAGRHLEQLRYSLELNRWKKDAESQAFLVEAEQVTSALAVAEEALDETVASLRAALEATPSESNNEQPERADLVFDLGNLLVRREQYRDAEEHLRGALELRRRLLGDEHVKVGECLRVLALLQGYQDDQPGKEQFAREALGIYRKHGDSQSSRVAEMLTHLIASLHAQEKRAETLPLYADRIELLRSLHGESDPQVAADLRTLVKLLTAAGDVNAARQRQDQAIDIIDDRLQSAAPQAAGELIPLDVQPFANQPLTTAGGIADLLRGNDFAALPRGEQTFAGVRFYVGDKLIQLGSQKIPNMPQNVEGIAVGGTAAKLHILHGTQYGSKWGRIGAYVVLYADGSSETIPIAVGRQLRDWWHLPEGGWMPPDVAWVGANEATRKRAGCIHLSMLAWKNPHPQREIASITFRSANKAAAPFCVAITVERPESDAGDEGTEQASSAPAHDTSAGRPSK